MTSWRDLRTLLLVKVDVSQGWTNLDAKVVKMWVSRSSIPYVLCDHLDKDVDCAEFKL